MYYGVLLVQLKTQTFYIFFDVYCGKEDDLKDAQVHSMLQTVVDMELMPTSNMGVRALCWNANWGFKQCLHSQYYTLNQSGLSSYAAQNIVHFHS